MGRIKALVKCESKTLNRLKRLLVYAIKKGRHKRFRLFGLEDSLAATWAAQDMHVGECDDPVVLRSLISVRLITGSKRPYVNLIKGEVKT